MYKVLTITIIIIIISISILSSVYTKVSVDARRHKNKYGPSSWGKMYLVIQNH